MPESMYQVDTDEPVYNFNRKYVLLVMMNESTGEIVFVKKDRPAEQKGNLNFPGGKVEKGETYLDAARRECLEETGLAIDNFALSGYIKGKEFASLGGGTFTIAIFYANVKNQPLKPREGETEVPFWLHPDTFFAGLSNGGIKVLNDTLAILQQVHTNEIAKELTGQVQLPFLILEGEELL